ncbi:MAG: membrane protein insertase YidC, partial [Chlamydiales bacterium]|nr:membrane protein insertase YidC [Chlamydiales bacterium]
EEKFFVLETPYQQFVFSNYGGALAEINLPFQSETNQLSVIREIAFDRDMVSKHPYNAYFPEQSYYTPAKKEGEDFVLHEKGQLGGYYPLLRRTLVEKPPRSNVTLKPKYYALNIVSEYPELAELVYEVKHFDKQSITFEASQGYRKITKTFSLGASGIDEAPYSLNVEINIDGDARGLWLTSGIPEVELISGSPAPSLKYRLTRNQKSDVQKIDLPTDATTVTTTYIDWICNSNGFLGMILDPLTPTDPGYRIQHITGTAVPSRLTEVDQAYDRFPPATMPGYMVLLPIKQKPGTSTFRFFSGPFDTTILNEVDEKYSNYATGYNPDYISCQTMHGWFTFISGPFSKFLFVLMNFFHNISGSWALSIFLLTVCLRLMLYPLNAWSTKSMVNMQKIGPEVTAIQEKYKKDPKKAQTEVLNLYRERGVNPASGCIPLLIQMPFLIGMFDLLKSSFALRGAPFIPGWIDDLTAPDVVFSWERPIFFIGTEFHLLPFLIGGVMFLQQRLMSTAPSDPKLMTDQQR